MTNQRYYPPQVPMNNPCPAALKTANTTNPPAPPNALEPHYSLKQIAEAWGISVRMARRIFRDQPGVVDPTVHKSLTSRPYQILRIPASVAARVHEQRSAGFVLGAKRRK